MKIDKRETKEKLKIAKTNQKSKIRKEWGQNTYIYWFQIDVLEMGEKAKWNTNIQFRSNVIELDVCIVDVAVAVDDDDDDDDDDIAVVDDDDDDDDVVIVDVRLELIAWHINIANKWCLDKRWMTNSFVVTVILKYFQ